MRVGRGLAELPEASQAIAERAAGNPLFAEQLVRHLEGEPEVADLAAVGGPVGGRRRALKEKVAQALPESLQSLIAARLDELPPTARPCSATPPWSARSSGRAPWPPSITATRRPPRRPARPRPARPGAPHFDSSVAGENEFAFRHALIRDVAYAQLTRADRAAKHAAVARWLEATAGERVDEVAEILAHHYLTALELARAAGRSTADELLEPTSTHSSWPATAPWRST